MPQTKPEWEEASDFKVLASKIVERYPQDFCDIDIDQIIAYVCVNKDRPDGKKLPYAMSGTMPPESFTNSKTYFVKMFQEVWDRDEVHKLVLIYSVLCRIDPVNPGKVKPYDYTDQEIMVKNFGANWHERADLPHLLKDNIGLRD